MTWVFIFIGCLLFAEFMMRILLAIRHKTLGKESFFKVMENPEGGMDWRIFSNFGAIDESRVASLFRFSTQSHYMGMTDDQMQGIMAEANNTDKETIIKVYSGPRGFEKSAYRPFVGFSTRPNQELNYVDVNNMGFQGTLHKFRKTPHIKRVLILGGSVAYGIGCTAKEHNITNKLQEILNKREAAKNSLTRWEVINFAFVASQSISEQNQMSMYASLYLPDVVIELTGFNDLYFFLTNKPKLFTYNFQDTVINYLSSSFLEKCFMLLARQLFLVKILLKISKNETQKKEGQLYTVW